MTEPTDRHPSQGSPSHQARLFAITAEGQESGIKSSKDIDAAREICLRQLHMRAHTSGELAATLRKRGVSDDVAQAALARLASVGLVDDVRFARDWIERHGSGKSRSILQRELVRKGVDTVVIRELLAEAPEPEGIERSIVARRWTSLRTLPSEVQVRRAAGLLARRGFDPAQAADVVAQLRSEEEEALVSRAPILNR